METIINRNKIRELDVSELKFVSGGIALGTGAGGIFGAGNIAAAFRLAGGLGLLASSAKLGWDLGSWGYTTYSNYKYNSR